MRQYRSGPCHVKAKIIGHPGVQTFAGDECTMLFLLDKLIVLYYLLCHKAYNVIGVGYRVQRQTDQSASSTPVRYE